MKTVSQSTRYVTFRELCIAPILLCAEYFLIIIQRDTQAQGAPIEINEESTFQKP